MSILKTVKRTKIYKEFTVEENEKYFELKHKKYIHNTDNIYYNIYLKNDSTYDVCSNILEFVDELKCFKEELKKDINKEYKDSFWYDIENNILFTRKCARLYNLCLTVNGAFDIFVASSIPNVNTPRIHVQIRSEILWSVGYERAIKKSYDLVNNILKKYDIEILATKENRIDFCYHSNYFDNPDKYFSDSNIEMHLDSTYNTGSKIFNFTNGRVRYETLTMGMRTSNNTFYRSYNKTKEILDKSHKYFFFDVWYAENLISFYDKYIFDYCVKYKKGYDGMVFGMAQFYVDFGKNDFFVLKLKHLLLDSNTNATYLSKILKKYLPFPTIILNFEFQTMAKFYYTSSNIIDSLTFRCDTDVDQLVRLFQILDNRKIFLDYLTSVTICWRENSLDKKSKILDFWNRLRNTKTEYIADIKLLRNYPISKTDVSRSEISLKKALAKMSCLKGYLDTTINEDYSVIMSLVNDNNIDDDGTITLLDEEYTRIKDKEKKKILKLQVAEPKCKQSSLQIN